MAPPSTSLAGKMSTLRYYVVIRETARDVMAAVLKMYMDDYSHLYNKLCNKNELGDKDITYLSSILYTFYEDGIITGKLARLLETIRIKRNEVLHNEKDFTTRQLANELNALHNEILNKIMCLTWNKVSRKHRTTIDNLMMKVDKDFKDIFEKVREKYDPSKPEDVSRYENELRDFGTLYPEFVRNESRKILKTLYSKQCRTRVLDWLSSSGNTDPSSVSVSLMVDIEKAFHLGRHPQKEINQTEILKEENPNGDKADVAIISGEAGAGKTTLIRFILELWSKGETENFPKLSDYDILIYFQLRDRDYHSLDDYIKHILDDVVKHFGLSTVKSSLFNSRCLFLLDGYDEINEKSKKLLEEILKLSQKSNKIVVTTRPINTKCLTKKVDKQQNTRVNLSLVGMTETIVLQSITKLVNKHLCNEDERKQMIKKLTDAFNSMPPEMKKLTKTPLYNNLIIMLSMETQECKIFDTITKLYEEITKHKLKRLVEKIESQNERKKIGQENKRNKIRSQNKRKVHEFQELYCYRSMKNLLDGQLELKGEDIQFFKTECDRLELPFENVMSAFFNTKHDLIFLNPKPTFCYRHTTEQEFAAAYGLFYILKKHKADNHETEGNIILYYLKKEFPLEYDEDEEDEDEEDEDEEDEDEEDEDEEDENMGDENKVEDEEDENKVEDKEDENKFEDKEDKYKVENKEDEAEEYRGTRLDNVLPFLAGILVNSKLDDERYMDCLIKLVTGDNIDKFLHVLSESIGSNNVINAIANRLSDAREKRWHVGDGRNLSYLQPLLLKIQPEKLELSISGNLTTCPDLKPALEAISSHGIVLDLNLYHPYFCTSGYSDEYFEAAKRLKSFHGSLSSKIFPLITDELESLVLRVEENHLTQQLLKSAKKLSFLALEIPYEENTGDDQRLCPLLYHGRSLEIFIDFKDFEGGGEGEGKSCARKLNELWPRLPTIEESSPPKKPKLSLKEPEGDELRCGINDMIQIENSSFSKDDIEDFINTLAMKRLWMMNIVATTDISEGNIQHLKTLAKERECTSDLYIQK